MRVALPGDVVAQQVITKARRTKLADADKSGEKQRKLMPEYAAKNNLVDSG
jgi:hypothetical protein